MRIFHKRIVTLLTVMLIAMTTASYAFSADSEVNRKKADVLVGLNILEKSPVAEDLFSGIAFKKAVFSIMGLDEKSGNAFFETKFPNIILDEKQAVTVGSAVKILIDILGYDVYAQNKGGYPSGYLIQADSMGLLAGVGSGNVLSASDAINILYNAITTDMLLQVQFGYEKNYTVQKGTTLLTKYLKLSYGSGVVTATPATSLNLEEGTPKGFVKIDDTVYRDENGLGKQFLGMAVEYYSKDNGDGFYSLIYIGEYRNKNKLETILSSDLDRSEVTTGNLICYYKNNKKGVFRLAEDVSVIYNGVSLFAYTKVHLQPKSGELLLIDRNNDGKIDTIKVKSYEVFMLLGVDKTDNALYLKEQTSPVDLSKYGEQHISIKKDGLEIAVGELPVGVPVAVAKSEADTSIEICVITKSVRGTVSEKGEEEIRIKGNLYGISKAFPSTLTFRAGESIKAYIDQYQELVWADPLPAYGEYYAYLLGADTKSALKNEDAKIKIVSPDGDVMIKKLTDRVNLNDSSMKPEDVCEQIRGRKELVRIVEDDEGDVSGIKLAEDKSGTPDYIGYTENKFTLDCKLDKFTIGRPKKSGALNYDNEMLAFYIPVNTDDDSAFKVEKAEQWTFDNTQVSDVYVYDVSKFAQPPVIVINGYDEGLTGNISHVSIIGYSTWFFAVERVVKCIDSEDKEVYKLTGYCNGEKISYYAKDDSVRNVSEYIRVNEGTRLFDTMPNNRTKWGFTNYRISDLKSGDVIQITLDGKKRITGFRTIFSNSIKGIASAQFNPGELFEICATDNSISEPGLYSSQMYTAYADVLETKGDLIRYRTVILVNGVKNTVERAVKVENNVYLYTENSRTMTKGKTTDIQAGDKIFLHSPTGQGAVANVLVIK